MKETTRILVVEDDANTREALQKVLESDGYSVVVAHDGGEGLRLLREGLRPALILMDLMMPDKNGIQLRVEQLLDPALAEIPVLVCSGDVDLRMDGMSLGAVAYLNKPFDPDELLAVVRSHCGAREES